jgi:poly(3-hydroxybutyrate) depolymerase
MRRRFWMTSTSQTLAALCVVLSCSVAQAREPIADTKKPTTPGVHFLKFDHDFGGKTQTMPYGLYVPPNLKKAMARGEKLPMVVSLGGRGGLGLAYEQVYVESAIGLMQMNKDYGKSVDYLQLVPMGALADEWRTARSGDYIVQAARRVIKHYPVDPNRVHIIGMSLGGEGVWHAAKAGPGLFATIVSLSGRRHPKPDAVAKAAEGSAVVIAVGGEDGEFTYGSRIMAKAMREQKIDLFYVEVPAKGHGLFYHYLYRPAVYDWMLLHERGQPAPAGRGDVKTFMAWGQTPWRNREYAAFSKALVERFQKFAPHWYIENCGMGEHVGPHQKLLGEKNVFVTRPLARHVACRIMTTRTIPTGKRTALHLDVAHVGRGEWQFTVNINGKQRLATRVGPVEDDPQATPWLSYQLDLTEHAGKQVFIELINARGRRSAGHAAWGRIELVSKAIPK